MTKKELIGIAESIIDSVDTYVNMDWISGNYDNLIHTIYHNIRREWDEVYWEFIPEEQDG